MAQPIRDVYEEVYKRIANLPAEETAKILREVLPPQELFMKMDGTAFVLHKYGLRLFEAKGLLEEVGIPEDDPRSAIYRSLLGSKIDEDIPKSLRAIAAKEETVGRNAGAIQVWDQGTKIWWVPIAATSKFNDAMGGLIAEFNDQVDRALLRNFSQIRNDSIDRFERAAGIAWEDMSKLGRITIDKDEYIKQSLDAFVSRFPSEEEIRSKVRLEMVAREAPLPPQVESILSDVRAAARENLIAQAEAAKIQSKAQETQLRITQLEEQLKQSELNKINEERTLRQKILREQILEDPEIKKAKEIVTQFQAGFMRVAHEILQATQSGADITPATKRSWLQRLNRFKELTPDNPDLEQAIQTLSDMTTVKSTESAVYSATDMVSKALKNIEQSANVELKADALWQMINAGKGSDALKQIENIRSLYENKINEVEALREMAITIGANNAPPVIGEEGV